MNLKRLTLFILFFNTFFAFSSNNSTVNTTSVLDKVKEYATCLSSYCSCQGKNLYEKQDSIYRLFKPSNINEDDTTFEMEAIRHPNDLCLDYGKPCRLDYYLLQIFQEYNNNINIAFSNFNILKESNDRIVFVSAQKKLICKGSIPNIISIVIGVDVISSPYYLRFVMLEEEFKLKYDNNKFNINEIKLLTNSDIPSKNSATEQKTIARDYRIKNTEDFVYYKNRADASFNKGHYRKAKMHYFKLLEYQPNSDYAKSMINMCESMPSFAKPRVSITNGFPSELQTNREYFGTVVFTYDDNVKGSPADLEINLPKGCSATIDEIKAKDFSFESSKEKIKIHWKNLPDHIPFMITYKVKFTSGIYDTTKGKLTGNFSYYDNDDWKTEVFENNF